MARPSVARPGVARPKGRAPDAPPLVTPVAPRPWGPSARLGAVVQAAVAAGASPNAIAALRQDEAAQKAERQTAGGRLDAARARVARTARAFEEAQAELAAAEARAKEAEQESQRAAAELTAVEADLAAQPAPPATEASADPVADGARALLEALESAPLPGVAGSGPALPEPVLAAMAALRARVDPAPQTPVLEQALEPGETPHADSQSEDEVMDELDGVADDNETELAAIALRLKRARRG